MVAGYQASLKLAGLTWDDALRRAREYRPPIQRALPQYVDEMHGLADGAGVAFDAVLLMNALEEVVAQTSHHLGCTSLAIGPARTASGADFPVCPGRQARKPAPRGTVLVGHNEDWLYQDLGSAYLVHAEPDGEPAFLSMTYGGFVPAVGFNEWGLAQCCDSIDHDDDQPGIPRMLVARRILAARSFDEAIQVGTMPGRAAGYNHLLADDSGRLCNLELSATDHDLLCAENGVIAHANCYLSPRMAGRAVANVDVAAESLGRVRRCLELLACDEGPSPPAPLPERARAEGNDESVGRWSLVVRQLGVEDVAAVLADHADGPESSICCHQGEIQDQPTRPQTIATVIIDLDAWVMWAAAGNPCRGTYYAHELEPEAEEEAA
jgi:isopenicillin-N N-acyltransferase-like protein